MNHFLTTLVQSRWLDIGQLFFCVFIERDEVILTSHFLMYVNFLGFHLVHLYSSETEAIGSQMSCTTQSWNSLSFPLPFLYFYHEFPLTLQEYNIIIIIMVQQWWRCDPKWCVTIKTESIRKLSNFNFQWTKTLYQYNSKHITFFFYIFQGLKM